LPRPWLAPTLALLLATPASGPLALLLAAPASGQADEDARRAADLALRDWSHAIGTTGYVYGAPLLDAAIAEYRQSASLGGDLAGPRGVLAHAMGGRLATHETGWQPAPDPDVLVSSAWLDLRAQPFVLYVPPLEGTWYAVRVLDDFGNLAGALTPRTGGSVGGWTVIGHASFEGPLPPRVQGALRVPTPGARVIVEIAATRRSAATLHERHQSKLKLLPLEIYRRSPAAAEFANAQPQGGEPPLRATEEMRGGTDAFRVIQQRLRRIDPTPGEEALLALFERAGFGPRAAFDAANLPAPQLAGLRDAARDGRRTLRDLRLARAAQGGWRSLPAPDPADLLARAVRGPASLPPEELLVLEAHRDADGRRLDGRSDYRIRFRPGRLPPAQAFWSIAAYASASERLFDSHGERSSVASLGDESLRVSDAAVELWISSDPPEDAALRAHWLPVGHEPFFLMARLRQPAPEALDGSWSMPPVEPAD
jgi:hypothetical protein